MPATANFTSDTVYPTQGNYDDGYFAIELPWDSFFINSGYGGPPFNYNNIIYVGTNSYITVGGGTVQYSGIINFKKLMVGYGDNVVHKLTYEVLGTAPNRFAYIKYEGYQYGSTYAATPIVWEAAFKEQRFSDIVPYSSLRLYVTVLQNSRSNILSGNNGLYFANSTPYQAPSDFGTPGIGYDFELFYYPNYTPPSPPRLPPGSLVLFDTQGPSEFAATIRETSSPTQISAGLPVVITLPGDAAFNDRYTATFLGNSYSGFVTTNDLNTSTNPSRTVTLTLPASLFTNVPTGTYIVYVSYKDAANNEAANSPRGYSTYISGITATYAITPSTFSVNEGSSLTFNITGSNIENGTYYWSLNRPSDFSIVSGSFTITNNTGSFSVTPSADFTTEGNETFTVSVRGGSTTGTILATSTTVNINDTSTATTNWTQIGTSTANRVLYISGSGVMLIGNSGLPSQAVSTPLPYVQSLYFHSGLQYLQIIGRRVPNVSLVFPAVNYGQVYWDDSNCDH